MSDSADLVCVECGARLYLGIFWRAIKPAKVIMMDGVPSWQDALRMRAMWKMMGEHIYHDLRIVGEDSPLWGELDITLEIGGEIDPGPSFEEYLADWPY